MRCGAVGARAYAAHGGGGGGGGFHGGAGGGGFLGRVGGDGFNGGSLEAFMGEALVVCTRADLPGLTPADFPVAAFAPIRANGWAATP